ncbi:hypothetical protein [Cryptosporangium aurantiacum]|uniref:Membrane protein involved in the export of O-antigen and teichoic acid n=1 Tax=Cryptosporangium aurantiacum TaxID=134849 RepID=A0A1M7QX25_9ACTN|nr:hypothetical protein [Cryptosporangium aurantiacum]SHN36514.1 Membrane protein involved in the export of O-antigen and teichoic acid [Cryptosporangium aurantiacum]
MKKLRGNTANAAGLADQLVSAGANAATGLLVLPFLAPAEAGAVLFAIGVGYFAIGIARALVGDVLLTYSARYGDAERARQATSATKTAGALGLITALIVVAAWATGPDFLSELIWLAPFLPFVLVHDAGRYVFLAARRPQRALISDLTYIAVQGVLLTALLVAGFRDGAVFLCAWGVGGVAGALSFLIRARINVVDLRRGDLRDWVRETRHLSGWLTLTALLGQAQVQFVYTLVTGLLTPAALSILRAAQYGLLMPAQNLQMAVSSLLVPRMSRLAGAGDRAGIARLLRRALTATALCGLVPVALSPLAGPLLDAILPKYAQAATIALPVAIQAAIYLVQVPFTAALRGMQRVRSLFVQYVVFFVTQVACLIGGTLAFDLRGAAWGMMAGSAVGLVTMVILYRRALAKLEPAEPDPGPKETDPPPGAATTTETVADENAGPTPVR